MLSVYVCNFDARQHVVFINKLFEFEFYIPEFPNNIIRTNLYTSTMICCLKIK